MASYNTGTMEPNIQGNNYPSVLSLVALGVVGVIAGYSVGSSIAPTTLLATSSTTQSPVLARPTLMTNSHLVPMPARIAVNPNTLVVEDRHPTDIIHGESLASTQGLSSTQMYGWACITSGSLLLVVAFCKAMMSRGQSPSYDSLAMCATSAEKETLFPGEETMKGMRWDGANLRWVKDPKAEVKVKYQPESGAAYTLWPVCHTRLVAAKLKSVTPEKALQMQKGGLFSAPAKIIDIRAAKQYDYNHSTGAVSVPLFGPVTGDAMMDNVKRLAIAAFAMEATERVPDFIGDAEKAGLKKSDTIIVGCSIGGTLDTFIRVKGKKPFADPIRQFGRESRSLKACYEFIQAGYKNVYHLEGGFQEWFYQGFPAEP